MIKERLVNLQNSMLVKAIVFKKVNGAHDAELIRLGSEYGGWWIPKFFLDDKEKHFHLVSVGLGLDVSFDKEILKLGGKVLGLDPIPSSFHYAESELSCFDGIRLLNKGLWVTNGSVYFEPPLVSGFASWKIGSTSKNKSAMKFDVIDLEEICRLIDSQGESDILMLKMDIEGAELNILEQGSPNLKRFQFLAVEMDFLAQIPFLHLKDRLKKFIHARKILKKLEFFGYSLVKIEGFNFYWSSDAFLQS